MPVNLPFYSKTYAASRERNIELLIIVSDFMVNSMLKILKDISMECMECLNGDAKKKRKKKGQILYIVGRDDPVPNCLILRTSLRDSVLINRGYQLLNINAV